MLDTILAILFSIIMVNSFKRLNMKAKARLTSWGMWLIMFAGFLFNLLPAAVNYDGVAGWLPWVRLAAYIVAIVLGAIDWLVYDSLTEEEKGRKIK